MVKDLKKQVRLFNQLWLSWDNINHLGDGTISLINARFSGPVLSDCLEIPEKGNMFLDFTNHYLIIIPKPYIVEIKWDNKISQDNTEAIFKTMTVVDNELGNLKLLKNMDKILIDCTDHSTEAQSRGKFKTSFISMVYDSNNLPYDLTR